MKSDSKKNKFLELFLKILIVYFALAGMLYWIGHEQMEAVSVQTSTVAPTANDGGLVGTNTLKQTFQVDTDTLDQLLIFTGTFGRQTDSEVLIEILSGNDVLYSGEYKTGGFKDYDFTTFLMQEPLENIKGEELTLCISTKDVPREQAVSFYFGNTVSTGKFDVPAAVEEPLIINGEKANGTLCLKLEGRNLIPVKRWYWPGVLILGILLTVFYWRHCWLAGQGRPNIFSKIQKIQKYSFLMKQLVSRDFKTKYKRSVLGVLWSFLNPLLTMGVQYLIFSTLFQSSIPNFAVYLMTGGILFNYFTEAVGLGLMSVVGNAPLITKVYVPKYIYPVSRVLSSAVNVLIAMIPLSVMILLSGVPLRKSMLLFPIVLLLTTLFCIGMSLLLSSLMVFFRDTQFLWGVVSMLWMYMTPIFYPETIIAPQFLTLYHMNPMYQFIYFLREITINGVAPGPMTFVNCTLAALLPLLLGIIVFKKTQDRFVFYL